MITSPRQLLRSASDARAHAHTIAWLNDQPAGRWVSLADAVPNVPMSIEQCSWAFHDWTECGWLEQRQDSGRTLWRPTPALPPVERSDASETESWGRFFSALLDLPVR